MRLFGKKRGSLLRLRRMAEMFSLLDRLEECGLLQWEDKERRLTVDYDLASLMMRRRDGWRSFLDNIRLWKTQRLTEDAWNSLFLREEMKSVRKAKRKTAHLTKSDIIRIRQRRREEIGFESLTPPRIEKMEVYVAGRNAENEVRIYAACLYGEDGELVMADYDEILERAGRLNAQDEH